MKFHHGEEFNQTFKYRSVPIGDLSARIDQPAEGPDARSNVYECSDTRHTAVVRSSQLPITPTNQRVQNERGTELTQHGKQAPARITEGEDSKNAPVLAVAVVV
jgi:hypothetical protein